MVRFVRGKIVSPLFRSKEIPTPVQTTEKGGKDAPTVARTDGASASVNMRTLRANLILLKAYADYLPSELPRTESDIYESIMHQLKLVHGMPPYENAMALINEIFSNKKVKTDSIAASLVGCTLAARDSHMGGCDPRCLDSLPKDNVTGNSCEMQVFVYEKGKLTHHGENHTSSKAYVFASEEINFSEADKELLNNRGVDTITVVHNEAGVYHKKPPMAVNQIKTAKVIVVEPTSFSSWQWWQWTLLVVFIIFLVALVLYLCYVNGLFYKKKVAPSAAAEVTKQNWWAYSG